MGELHLDIKVDILRRTYKVDANIGAPQVAFNKTTSRRNQYNTSRAVLLHLFCFRGRSGNLLKVIWHDGQGACLFTKRLERGRFLWASPADGAITISPAQLGYLLSGIDWRNPQETWRPTSVG